MILKSMEKKGEIFSIVIDGGKDILYAPEEDRLIWESSSVSRRDYVRFLAPLDPLLWSRRVFKTLYGMEYIWEVYKRPIYRKYGYYK